MRTLVVPNPWIAAVALAVVACSSSSGSEVAQQQPAPPADLPPAQPPAPPADDPIPPRFADVAAAAQAEMKELGAPGLAIAVIEHGEVTFAHGFGTKTPGKNDPVKATTLFRIGSCTKALTATAVLRLVADGKISLDDPVVKSFPEFHFTKDATWAPPITVKELLDHTAGQVDNFIGDATTYDDSELQRYYSQDWPNVGYVMFPAGRMFDYANPNFEVAGVVVERASGKSYRQFMKEAVFGPIGMSRTIFTIDEIKADGDVADGLATTFSTNGSPMTIAKDSYDSPAERPAGFALSSVYDMAKFAKFVVKGDDTVLPSAQRVAMESPQVDIGEVLDLDHYGFGVEVNDFLTDHKGGFWKIRNVGHSGAIPGYSAEWRYVPDLDVGVVLLSNADGAYYAKTIMTVLKTIGNLGASQAPPDLKSDPSTFAALAGTYQDVGVGTITIGFDSGNLTIAIPAAAKQGAKVGPALTPVTPNNFEYTLGSDTDVVTFFYDASGKPEYVRSREYVGHRTDTTTAPTHLPERPVDASALIARAHRNAPEVRRALASLPR